MRICATVQRYTDDLYPSETLNMIRQAVVLVGGRGTRLGDLCSDMPKPMLPCGDVPFLEYIVWNLKRFGIKKILFSVGYLGDRIRQYFGDGSRFGVVCTYYAEEKPAGTGGALVLARDLLEDNFLVLNGDTLFDINYLDLALLHGQENALATVALRREPDASRYGSVIIKDSKILSFCEKVSQGHGGLINGGIYCLAKSALDFLPSAPASLENDLFPALAGKGQIVGKEYNGFFIDIGLPATLKLAGDLIPAWRLKPAVFFDRDGVLNVDKGYVHSAEDFEWILDAKEAVKYVNDNGYYVFVVTNQAGIGREYYSEEDFLRFSGWINEELMKSGAHIDATFFCPHHPTAGKGEYKKICNCRKPGIGMLEKAVREWDIDLAGSLMIGDKEKDLIAAKTANIAGYLFSTGSLLKFIRTVLTI